MDENLNEKPLEIGPQPGPQTDFLSCVADIAIYGGAAGGGKTYALCLEPLRHYENSDFGGVIFRRTTKQIKAEGGLWDTAQSLYVPLGCEPRYLQLVAPSGMRIEFAHLEHEKNIFDWQGSQIPFIGFDELTHFTQNMFFYMLSRLRSTSGVPGYVRATCNPDADSWVRQFIDWWIGEDGFPIKARAGKLRWFIRIDGNIIWGNTRQELIDKYGKDELPLSVTFIPSKLSDNPALTKKDPSYLAKLRALSKVDRERLLDGNWNVRAVAGTMFKAHWFEVVDAVPAGCRSIRFWDRAATEVSDEERRQKKKEGADWTAGLSLFYDGKGTFYIADVKHEQLSPGRVESLVKNTAKQDGVQTEIGLEQEPGAAGVADIANFVKLLIGFIVRVLKPMLDKITRAKAVSAQAERGNVKIVRGKWNAAFLQELENFPDGPHDDQVDALSGAFNMIAVNNTEYRIRSVG